MPDPISLTQAADGQTVAVQVGQTVTVALPENASTGYRWAVERADPALVSVQAGAAHAPAGPPGAGGTAVWVLTPKAPGVTEVVLKKARSWEGAAGVAERFHLTLRIGG